MGPFIEMLHYSAQKMTNEAVKIEQRKFMNRYADCQTEDGKAEGSLDCR